MYFVDKIKNDYSDKKLIIFVDMDGVIADFEAFKPLDFLNKRPIKTNINTLKEVSKLKNVELHILSICKLDKQINEKNIWLDNYASFFKYQNRHIISKETFSGIKSKDLKCDFLKNFIIKKSDELIILIDDDNDILKYINDKLDNVILFQDSSIVD